jgi:indoleamine 2,3-dioxygenase
MQWSSYTDGFFNVSAKNGFLPVKDPLRQLPERYAVLQQLINQLPVEISPGHGGLLAEKGSLTQAVAELPNYNDAITAEEDVFVLQALFRAYAFLTSGYTLVPAHWSFTAKGNYGKARTLLPKNIAQPFTQVAKKLEVYPWIDYHYAYSLGNYYKIDPKGGFNWENLGMCVKFSGKDDERGFIMLHVDINQHSPQLIDGIAQLTAAEHKEHQNKSLALIREAITKMNERRKLMWGASRWKHYNDFRVFIMGIKGNEDLFGAGLVYEGVSEVPQQYRGQTGAQDNIIPTLDILTGINNTYEENELTAYLLDLRKYRPKCIQRFLADLKATFQDKSLLERITEINNTAGLHILFDIIDEVYFFRNGHWQFVQKYIMHNTAYPKATGGTPIVSWIPNQIKAVIRAMEAVVAQLPEQDATRATCVEKIRTYKTLLNKQLQALNIEEYKPEEIYQLNKKYNLLDARD